MSGSKYGWSEEYKKAHNERRRSRYNEDPEYRAKCLAASREARKRQALQERKGNKVVGNLRNWKTFAVKLKAITKGRGSKKTVLGSGQGFTYTALAKLLDRKERGTILQWVDKGLLPKPMLMATVEGREQAQPVWSMAEVEAMVGVFKHHYETNSYYGVYHENVRVELVLAVGKVR